ncbi:LysE family translocator [Actinomadura kijaniata]|uniref:Threonine/homoserine/homoserine lactone efflux protein n=1 Tax=Actinomadura namibiensis TaxID=182080 RepID=A0A7W3QLE4_ACTNM|nr:LysE family translocator [Actinomadura namibiensis]MBA8951430.1 threonine/homoserine/homoserine lactone efflux protein [Actinomadura namibiensis]
MSNPLLFLLAAVTLIVIPGPNHLYITARSVAEGPRSGLVSGLGVEVGTLVHVAAAAAGLSALVAASTTAFNALRYAGAAYLIYLAYRTFRARDGHEERDVAPQPLRRVFLDGLLINLFNPKVVLFFLAFLPQFVDQGPDAMPVPLQIVVMGVALSVIGMASDALYAVAAGSIGSWLRARPVFRRRQRYATGFIYLGLGAAAVLAGPSTRAK